MNYQLISAILKGTWAIDEESAEAYYPFIHGILNHQKIETEFNFNEKDFQPYSLERNSFSYQKFDGGFDKAPKNSIAVIPIHGVLMRQDQACGPVGMETIGERIKEAQNNPNIQGILFVTNSPGGTVDGLHELGNVISSVTKPKLTFVKGMMASAAVWLASYSDMIIAASTRTQVGSIGTMMGYTDTSSALEKLGIKEHIIRSSFSPNKNKYQDQIKKGDYVAIQKEILDPLAIDFINLVKTNMPNLKEDQLTGDVYYAQDVIGTFIDAIGDFDFAVAELNNLIDEQEGSQSQENSNSNQTSYAMENQYPNVNAALGVPTLESEEAGIYLQEEQIATLDQAITTAQSEKQTALNAQAAAETTLANVQSELAAAKANNIKLVEQIENAGTGKPAGASIADEPIEGADAQDTIAEMDHIKEAKAKLNEY